MNKDIVLIAGFAITFIALAYLVRSIRALHRKENRNADRISKELTAQTGRIKSELGNVYHQFEAVEQLLPLLKLSAPLPPSRGWAASPDFLLTLAHVTKRVKPRLTVELGSGISTLVLAKSHGVRGVDIRIHELETYSRGYKWYARSTFKGIAKIDLLVIDGPPSSTNPDARYPAFEHLIPLLSPKATVILDDVYRDEERKLADAIVKALPGHVMTILSHEKGTAVISPRTGSKLS